MKKIINLIAGVCVLTAGSAFANPNYVGLEYKYSTLKAKDDWKKVAPKNKHNLGVVLGKKFHENFGLEVGYSQSNKKTKNTAVTAADTFFGTNFAGATTLKEKVRMKSWQLDANGYYPMSDCLDWVASVGFAATKAKVSLSDTSNNVNVASVKGKTKFIPRLGVGAEYGENNWGVRGKVMWENTSRLRYKLGTIKNDFPNTKDKGWKDSVGVTLAAFWKF